jgi:hypothetical protein
MPPEKPLAGVYAEAENRYSQIQSEELQWGLNNLKTNFPVYQNNRFRGYISRTSHQRVLTPMGEQKKVVLTLQRHGIFVPRIRAIDPNGFIEYEPEGTEIGAKISELFRRKPTDPLWTHRQLEQKRRVALQWMANVFRMMGRVHALGIDHGHPHSGNILLQGNTPGLIDFKLARTVPKESFNDLESLVSHDLGFHLDYSCLSDIYAPLSNPGHWLFIQNPARRKVVIRRLWGRLVARYPSPDRIKRPLLEYLLRGFA